MTFSWKYLITLSLPTLWLTTALRHQIQTTPRAQEQNFEGKTHFLRLQFPPGHKGKFKGTLATPEGAIQVKGNRQISNTGAIHYQFQLAQTTLEGQLIQTCPTRLHLTNASGHQVDLQSDFCVR